MLHRAGAIASVRPTRASLAAFTVARLSVANQRHADFQSQGYIWSIVCISRLDWALLTTMFGAAISSDFKVVCGDLPSQGVW